MTNSPGDEKSHARIIYVWNHLNDTFAVPFEYIVRSRYFEYLSRLSVLDYIMYAKNYKFYQFPHQMMFSTLRPRSLCSILVAHCLPHAHITANLATFSPGISFSTCNWHKGWDQRHAFVPYHNSRSDVTIVD